MIATILGQVLGARELFDGRFERLLFAVADNLKGH